MCIAVYNMIESGISEESMKNLLKGGRKSSPDAGPEYSDQSFYLPGLYRPPCREAVVRVDLWQDLRPCVAYFLGDPTAEEACAAAEGRKEGVVL